MCLGLICSLIGLICPGAELCFVLQELSNLPENNATEAISDAIAEAVKTHQEGNGSVLMVVQPGEKNSYDQQVF